MRNAGFGPKHFKGFVEIVPEGAPSFAGPSAQAHLAAGDRAVVKEAASRPSLRFDGDFEEIGAGEKPGLLQYSPSVAKYSPPSLSALRDSRQEFPVHPELPENLLSRKDTQRLYDEFSDRDVTGKWLRFTGQQRRESVIQGMNWPEQLNRFIASCLYYQLPLKASMRTAWDRIVKKGLQCQPTRLNTWFGDPPTEADGQLHRGRVVDLSTIRSAVDAAEQGVYFIQDPGFSTILDSGCSPAALANRKLPGLRNVRLLQPVERFRVKGIAGVIEVREAGDLHFRIPSKLYHDDSILREQLALLQVQLSREGPLFYYFKIPCFVDDDLPLGVTLVSLGQAVWEHRWRIQLDPDPNECYGLSDTDSATGARLQFQLSIGDSKGRSSGSASALLKMPGLELVHADVDDVAAARETWASVRALCLAASENIAANRCGLTDELAAYSLVGGYTGFYAAQEPEEQLTIPAAARLPGSPANRTSFRALSTDDPGLHEDTPQVTEFAKHAAPVEHAYRFPKRLFNQLLKSAKRAERRRRQSADFLTFDSHGFDSPDLISQEGVVLVSGNLPNGSSAAGPAQFSVSRCTALSLVDSLHSLPALPVCHRRLSLEAGGMSAANEVVSSVPVTEAHGFNTEAPNHSVSRSLSAFVSQQLLQFRSFEAAAGGAIRDGTAVLLKQLSW